MPVKGFRSHFLYFNTRTKLKNHRCLLGFICLYISTLRDYGWNPEISQKSRNFRNYRRLKPGIKNIESSRYPEFRSIFRRRAAGNFSCGIFRHLILMLNYQWLYSSGIPCLRTYKIHYLKNSCNPEKRSARGSLSGRAANKRKTSPNFDELISRCVYFDIQLQISSPVAFHVCGRFLIFFENGTILEKNNPDFDQIWPKVPLRLWIKLQNFLSESYFF